MEGDDVSAYAQKKSQKEKNPVCGKEAIFKVLMADVFPKWKIGILTLMSTNQNKWKEIRITEYNKVGNRKRHKGSQKQPETKRLLIIRSTGKMRNSLYIVMNSSDSTGKARNLAPSADAS